MDQLFLDAIARLETKVEKLGTEVNELKIQIAGRPLPARPCEYLNNHLDDHRAQEAASRAFWYQRLGGAIDALWKPILALLLLGAILSGQLKIDILRRADSPNPTAKEAQK